MSTDIMTNQISKDALNTSSVAKTKSPVQTQKRQDVAAPAGNPLPQETETAKPSKEDLQQAVSQLNDSIQQVQRGLLFSVDDSSGETIVQVVDTETEEVIRQIPSEEVLRISRNIKDQVGDVTGFILKTSA